MEPCNASLTLPLAIYQPTSCIHNCLPPQWSLYTLASGWIQHTWIMHWQWELSTLPLLTLACYHCDCSVVTSHPCMLLYAVGVSTIGNNGYHA